MRSQEKSAQFSPKAACGKIQAQGLSEGPPLTVTPEGVPTPPTLWACFSSDCCVQTGMIQTAPTRFLLMERSCDRQWHTSSQNVAPGSSSWYPAGGGGTVPIVDRRRWLCPEHAAVKQAASTSLSLSHQSLLWLKTAFFQDKILTKFLKSLLSVVPFYLWKGHKPSYTEYGYFKAEGSSDFSTMGILTCAACQWNEHIQEKWLKSSCFLKLGTVLSLKCANFFSMDVTWLLFSPSLYYLELDCMRKAN